VPAAQRKPGPPGAAPTVSKSTAPGQKGAASPLAHVDEHITYHNTALGRRYPFTSLVVGV
jgi:hypothetical protein